jgi:hypothetical protein
VSASACALLLLRLGVAIALLPFAIDWRAADQGGRLQADRPARSARRPAGTAG